MTLLTMLKRLAKLSGLNKSRLYRRLKRSVQQDSSSSLAFLSKRLSLPSSTTVKQVRQFKEQLAASKAELKLVRNELQKASRFEFGSYSPGINRWREKWEMSSGRRVLYYAPKDYSGSFFKWATAVNEHTDFAIRMAVAQSHSYGYENDLVLPDPRIRQSEASRLIEQADVIHIKDEQIIFEGRSDPLGEAILAAGKPLVFTHYGGYARKYKDDERYRSFVKSFAARIAMTPDLAYSWFDGHFIPHAIDTTRFQYSWSDGKIIAHSPSTESRKGTSDFLVALENLDLELDLIKGAPHLECLKRKAECNIFFDQAGRERAEKLGVGDVIGWYGNSALESAVHGIPTIAHLSEDAISRGEACGVELRDRCGIINTPLGAPGIQDTLKMIIAMQPSERRDLSLKTRRWVEDFHSYPAVAKRLAALYGDLL